MPVKEFKRFDVKSVAILFALLGGIYGLVGGLIYASLVFTAGLPIAGFAPGLLGLTAIAGGLCGGIFFGFVGGAVSAFLYNVIASRFGGIKFEMG